MASSPTQKLVHGDTSCEPLLRFTWWPSSFSWHYSYRIIALNLPGSLRSSNSHTMGSGNNLCFPMARDSISRKCREPAMFSDRYRLLVEILRSFPHHFPTFRSSIYRLMARKWL